MKIPADKSIEVVDELPNSDDSWKERTYPNSVNVLRLLGFCLRATYLSFRKGLIETRWRLCHGLSSLAFNRDSYTPRTLRACCSQSKFRILKISESSARALFLYNCTPNISRSADASVIVA